MSTPPPVIDHSPAGTGRSLSPFLLASIGLLVVVTIGAIVLLFVGDFEYRFSRVFATLIVFALFTGLTGLDTSRALSSRRYYTPFALFANVYMLALTLVVIWVRDKPISIMFFDFLGITLYVFVLGRVAVFGASVLLRAHKYGRQLLFAIALASATLLAVCAVLFTIPVGMFAFHVAVPDMYWRICVALLIITALGIAVTSLLYWTLSADDRAARKQARPGPYAGAAAAQHPHPGPAEPAPVRDPAYAGPVAQPSASQQPTSYPSAPQHQPMNQSSASQWQQELHQPHYQPGPPQPPYAASQQPAQPAPQAWPSPSAQRPWPVLPDGRPVPALPNGQPDFDALRRAVSGEPQ